MPQRPAVTVVSPCFNEADSLRPFLEDLRTTLDALAATYEVIVVDDGSTDATRERFGNDPRLKYIRQANAGPSAARNAGLAVSTGEFILSLDHDDVLNPEYLKHVMLAFEKHPAAQIIWTNFATAGTETYPDYLEAKSAGPTTYSLPRHLAEFVNARRGPHAMVLLTPPESAFLFSHYGGLSNSALVIRRSALKGWNARLRIMDDWGMLLNIVTTGSCAAAFVSTPLWTKRLGPHNLAMLSLRLPTAIADAQVLTNEYGPKVARSAGRIYRNFLADLHYEFGYRLSVEGLFIPAVTEYWRAFRVIPSAKPFWWMIRATARYVFK